MCGWVKTYRSLADHWLAEQPEKLGWWVLLLLKVNHEDKKMLVGNNLIEVKRGQIAASFSYLSALWHTSKRTAERFVEILEKDGMVSRCTSRKITVLTICNYESYQEVKTNTCANTCTNDEPIGSQSVAETKNEKERKEINITTTPRAREESIEWDDNTENAYLERFKAQGSARDAMRMTGKTLREVMEIMDVYRAKRKLQNRGHESYDQFCNLFVWYLEQGKIPQTTAQPQSGVISGQAIFDRIK